MHTQIWKTGCLRKLTVTGWTTKIKSCLYPAKKISVTEPKTALPLGTREEPF